MDEKTLIEMHAEAEAEAAMPEEGAAAAPVVAVDPGAEWAGLIGLVVTILSPALPYLSGIYDEATRDRIGHAMAPVAEKYGWNTSEIFGRYGAEIGLAMAVGPVALQTVKAHREWKAAQAAAAMAKAKAAAAARAAAVDAVAE